ncbi:MAG: polysaccharide biosynthesis/export family protein [Planctomycetota bacterium]|nr:polysaccharide biosynthesis/export family protein [Planctomycetota bacterium]
MSHIPTRRPRIKPLLALACAWLLPAGCAHYTDVSNFVVHPRPLVTATEYRLGPPDVITIVSKRVREISGHQEQIRPDGKITLPLLGSYFVAGKTCEEASADLQLLARQFYDDAGVSLRVETFNSKRIYVFGEVGSPGPYAYNGANTILDVLARAQPTRLAEPNRIHILRPARAGSDVKRMTIDLDEMVKRGDTALDAVLEEGDIIYVPANGLATVGLAFQQLLLPIQPAAATVRGPADISSSSSSYGNGSSTTSNR